MKTTKSLFALLTISAALICLPAVPSLHATEALLTDDTTTFSGSAAGTYGDYATLLVNTTTTKTALLKFEIATMLPGGITADHVATATLRMFVAVAPTGTGSMTAHTATATFAEATQGGVFSSYNAAFATVPVALFELNQYVAIDVTSVVKDWITNPSNNKGFVLRPSGTIGLSFDSKEGTGNPPVLEITFTTNRWLSGTSDPAAGTGSDGDFYLNSQSKTYFGPKAGGAWPAGVVLAGTAGRSVLNGSGAPTGGVDGDFFIDTTNSRIYGPKAAGTWPAGFTTLVGPQGPQGIQGPTVTRVSAQGNLSMGSFTAGTPP